ncbi:5-oxoprolinase-like isoform X3 [Clavelina lepadiformis]|uniref:5-oxoprolinase-like isoform X3 n=1 Tax=Clavelina lepadiformis TaxID=159417 RepID=UPI004040FCBE
MIHGPAIIVDNNGTILAEPNCKAKMTKKGDITIMIGKGKPKHIGKELDAIQLSIFSHRNDLTSPALFSDPMVVLFPTLLTSQST